MRFHFPELKLFGPKPPQPQPGRCIKEEVLEDLAAAEYAPFVHPDFRCLYLVFRQKRLLAISAG